MKTKKFTRPSAIIMTALIFLITGITLAANTADDRAIRRKKETLKAMKTEARTALVIGNGDYAASPLLNPVNDARTMAETLKNMGFDVTVRENLDFQDMNRVIDAFGETLNQGGVGLFYYAGHGVQANGKNYLIPVKSNIRSENEVKYRAVDAGLVLAKMESARNRLNIVILDACRDNPFTRSFRSAKQGLAYTDAPVGSLIAYATAPGRTASDGSGDNGLYTAELIRQMQTPGLRIEDVFYNVRREVRLKSSGKQVPWESTSLEGPFYFKVPSMLADSGGVVVEQIREPSELTVRSDVYRADVYLNGKKMGTSPLRLKELNPGRYAVKVAKDGYRDYEKTVDVKPGRSLEVTASLEKIETRPAGVWKDAVTGMEFVYVKGGCYQMGDTFGDGQDDEKPVHEVCVDDFYMGKFEVTVGQWRKFAQDTGYRTEAEKGGGAWVYTGKKWEEKKDANWDNPYFKQNDNHPVTCVSWNDAVEYAKWLSKQSGKEICLSIEAEWEYAARSGGKKQKYAGEKNVDTVAWYYKNSGGKTHSVGTKDANGLEIFDMSGNVLEWCQDWYDSNYYKKSSKDNPQGASAGSNRVFRGGSWNYGAGYCRSANRFNVSPGGRFNNLGFRLLRTPEL